MANEITVRIRAEDDISAVLKKIQNELKETGDSAGRNAPKVGGKGLGGAFNKLKGSIAGATAAAGPYIAGAVAIGAAIKGIVTPLFNAAREVEALKSQLKAVQGSAEGAEKRFNELAKVSKEITGLDLNSLIKYDNVLQTVGVSAEESATILRGIAEASSEAGLSADKTRSVTEQLSQAFASNKVQAEDLKTVWRELPAVQTVAKDLFGETAGTIEGLRETFEALGIDARKGLGELFAGVEKVSEIDVDTFNAQWEMFNETMNQWAATLGGPLVDGAKEILKWVNSLTEKVEEWFEANFSGNANWHTLVEIIKAVGEGLKPVFDGILKGVEIIAKIRHALNLPLQGIKLLLNNLDLLVDGMIAVTGVFNKELAQQFKDFKKAKEDQIAENKAAEEAIKAEATATEEHNEQLMTDLAEARKAHLAASVGENKASFEERKTLANAYFDAEEARINALPETDKTKNDQLVENAKNRKTALDTINKQETDAYADTLKNKLTDARTYYADLKRDETTSVADLKAARLAVYEYNKQIIESTETDETAKKEKLANLSIALKNDLKTIEDDKAKYNEKKRQEEITAEKEANAKKEAEAEALKTALGNKMKARASEAKLELDKIVADETSSLDEQRTANNKYYAFLKAEATAREKDADLLKAELNKIEGQRIAADEKLINDHAKEQDRVRKAEEKAQKDAKDEAVKRATELKDHRISELNALEEEQLGVIAELDRSDDASVDDRIAATKKLYGIRFAALEANKQDNKNYAADKKKLENDLKNDIAEIIDEDKKKKLDAAEEELTEKKRIAKERLDIEQDSFNDITASAESSVDDINKAAQDLYNARVEWINLNIKDEKERARQILQAQKELDANRTSSIKQFWEKNSEYIQAGLDEAFKAAETQMNISRQLARAERDLQHERAKAEIDFDTEQARLREQFRIREVGIRTQMSPQIEEAFYAGDMEEVRRLEAEADRLVGRTAGGQVILDEFGNFQGLVAEEHEAFGNIVADFNDTMADHFEELRNIQHEANKERKKAWWDLGAGIVDIGLEKLGEGIGAIVGSPEAGKFIGDLVGDAAAMGINELGERHVDRIEDAFLRGEIQRYQAAATQRLANEQAGRRLGGELDPLLVGTEFDPEVIQREQQEAAENIQRRVEELFRDEVTKAERLRDAKKRIFDQTFDNESKTIEQTKAAYQAWYDNQKKVIEMTIHDVEDRNDAIIRLGWDRTDTLTAIDNEFTRRAEEENQKREDDTKKSVDKEVKIEKDASDTKISTNRDVTKEKVADLETEVEAVEETQEEQVKIVESAGLSILDIVAAINATKEALVSDEVAVVADALDTEVKDHESAGLNILHIVQALNAQKTALTKDETQTTATELATQVQTEASAGLNILHIVAALNDQKKALASDETTAAAAELDSQTEKEVATAEKIKEEVQAVADKKEEVRVEGAEKEKTLIEKQLEDLTAHYTSIKDMAVDAEVYRVRLAGASGTFIKAGLDNTLDDYKQFYAALKEEADKAYEYMEARQDRYRANMGADRYQTSQRRQRERRSFSSRFQDRVNNMRGGNRGNKQVANINVKFPDGTIKKLNGEIEQIKQDNRGVRSPGRP